MPRGSYTPDQGALEAEPSALQGGARTGKLAAATLKRCRLPGEAASSRPVCTPGVAVPSGHTLELYTLAARQPAFRQITQDWMRRSRQALERLVDARTAHQLDALIEGLFIHISLDPTPRSRAVTRDAVRRILSL